MIDLQVIYLSDAGAKSHSDPGFSRDVQWDVPLLDGYNYQVLQPGTPITSRRFWQLYDRNLRAALERTRPDWLLLYGYASRMNWVAARWARHRRVKLAYNSDSNIHRSERFVPVKKLVLGHFFRGIDVFLAPSEHNLAYLLKYCVDRRKVQRIPFAIDTTRFTPEATTATRKYDFIWVGKFLAYKHANDFIDALRLLASRSERPIKACIAGDGFCRENLLAQAQALPGHCTLDFVGFVNQGQMPALLQSAQTLVFTSDRDAYGLVATEAAAAGLALVVAEKNGCVGATVLAQPGINALTYDVGDVKAIASAMEKLLDDAVLRNRMQRASLAIAKSHDTDYAAAVIEQVVEGNRSHA